MEQFEESCTKLGAKLSKAQEDTSLTSTSMLDHLSIHLFVMKMFLYYGKSYQNVMQIRGVGGWVVNKRERDYIKA